MNKDDLFEVYHYPTGKEMNKKMDEEISSISDNSERHKKAWETLKYAFDKIDDNQVFLGITAVKYIPSNLRDEEKELLNKYLLESLHIRYHNRDTILTFAQKLEHTITLVKALIAAGANPKEAKDIYGNNVIHTLCHRDSFINHPNFFCKLLEILVDNGYDKHGADINARNNDGETPIYVLLLLFNIFPYVDQKHEIATCLKKHGADPDIKNNYGRSFNNELDKLRLNNKKKDYYEYFVRFKEIMNEKSSGFSKFLKNGGKKTHFKKNKLQRKRRTRKRKGNVQGYK
jgi:hypothetical protein